LRPNLFYFCRPYSPQKPLNSTVTYDDEEEDEEEEKKSNLNFEFFVSFGEKKKYSSTTLVDSDNNQTEFKRSMGQNMGNSKLTSTAAERAKPIIADIFTTILAASSKLSQANIRRFDDAINAFASSTNKPCKRTTIGIFSFNVCAAAIIPSAITSQRIIPPNILTRIACTLESDEIIRNASFTCCAVAPPPTSKKLAGLPPCNLIMSIVAIAKPAPLTKQPISPSNEI
ncbi:hypothetical protein DERF_005384, partial [Dermatophagoides farinae]